jgi:serralysin
MEGYANDSIVEGPKLHDNVLEIDGDVFAIDIGFTSIHSAGRNTDINIAATGHVWGDTGIERYGNGGSIANAGLLEAFDKGIALYGADANILNSGTITSDRFGIFSEQHAGSVHITNQGTIEAELAIFVDGPARIVNAKSGVLHTTDDVVEIHSSAGDKSLVVNKGLINSDSYNGGILGGDGVERVINRGEIHGDVALGDGDDYFDTRGGTFNSAFGGMGDDVYVISGGGSLREYAGGGHDLVKSTVSWTLGDFFEDLTLIGHDDVNATGNAAANALRGNGGANILMGMQGHDLLTGGAGVDTFVFASGWGKDTVMDFVAGEDHIDLSAWAAVNSFQDVKAHLSVDGDDLVIKAGHNELTLADTHKSDLHITDFIF